MSSQQSINWNDIIKKEARGANDDDLGEVQDVGNTYVHTKKGLISKDEFYLPKYLVEGYDGDAVRFRITKDEAKNMFIMESAPSDERFSHYKERKDLPADIETRIPLIGEKLNVSKTQREQELRIKKEPVIEQKSVEVPVTHEEVTIERRPATAATAATGERPVTSETDITVPLKSEQIHVSKEPYVKEEVAVKKKPVTETKTITDEVRSESVNVEGENLRKSKTR